jgi:nucleotide-binding universal stress UspA family protein
MGTSTVVIGYVASESGERVLAEGMAVARALGAQVHLVTGFSDGVARGDEPTPQQRAAEQELGAVAERLGAGGLDVRAHVVPRAPTAAILEVADQVGPDLIVVGNRRAQGRARLLGSVASAVVAQAACNVLVVKSN